MDLQTRTWDASEHLNTPEDIAAYLNAVLAEEDPQLLAAALGDVAKARGMTQLAAETGLSREALYRALSIKGNPEFATVLKVFGAFGLHMSATPREAGERA